VADKNVAGRVVQASPSGHAPIDTVADPIDTDAMRDRYAEGGWEVYVAEDGHNALRVRPTLTADVTALCDEVDRLRAEVERLTSRGIESLRAENAALAAALEDIAGMMPVTAPSGFTVWIADAECFTAPSGFTVWIADAECSRLDDNLCHVAEPTDTDSWCSTCVAEVAWCAWKMGVLG